MGRDRESPTSPNLSAPMGRRGVVGSCIASLLLLSFLITAGAAGATVEKIDTARTDAIHKLDLQLDFPKPTTPPEPINWGHWNFEIPPVFLWALLGLLIALALWWLREPLLSLRLQRRAKRPEVTSESTVGEETAEAGLAASADALARAGRYAEAIHELLLQSLTEIRAGLQEQFADSLTSREILRSTSLASEGRRALAEIIGRVEWSHFGRRDVGEADYLACR